METIQERIETILRFTGLKRGEFEKIMGMGKNSLSNITNKGYSPQLDLIQKIVSVFNELDTHWLITGEGPMFKSLESGPEKMPAKAKAILEKMNAAEKSANASDAASKEKDAQIIANIQTLRRKAEEEEKNSGKGWKGD